jgi:hypothetical protein
MRDFKANWVILFILWGFTAHACSADIDCFATGSTGAAYVSTDSPDLLATANVHTSKITSVSFGDRTCVLAVAVVDRQEWALVQGYWIDLNHRALQGWLPLGSLVYRNKMVHHQHVGTQTVDVEIGDYTAQYKVQSGGAFTVQQVVSEHKCRKTEVPNEFGACEDVATVVGYFYGRGKLAVAISKELGELDIFKLNEDGRLCPWQYGDMPDICR